MPGLGETWALPVALLAIVNISATWYKVVSGEVAEPYLVCSSALNIEYGQLIYLNRMNSSMFHKRRSTAMETIHGIQKLQLRQACMLKESPLVKDLYG